MLTLRRTYYVVTRHNQKTEDRINTVLCPPLNVFSLSPRPEEPITIRLTALPLFYVVREGRGSSTAPPRGPQTR